MALNKDNNIDNNKNIYAIVTLQRDFLIKAVFDSKNLTPDARELLENLKKAGLKIVITNPRNLSFDVYNFDLEIFKKSKYYENLRNSNQNYPENFDCLQPLIKIPNSNQGVNVNKINFSIQSNNYPDPLGFDGNIFNNYHIATTQLLQTKNIILQQLTDLADSNLIDEQNRQHRAEKQSINQQNLSINQVRRDSSFATTYGQIQQQNQVNNISANLSPEEKETELKKEITQKIETECKILQLSIAQAHLKAHYRALSKLAPENKTFKKDDSYFLKFDDLGKINKEMIILNQKIKDRFKDCQNNKKLAQIYNQTLRDEFEKQFHSLEKTPQYKLLVKARAIAPSYNITLSKNWFKKVARLAKITAADSGAYVFCDQQDNFELISARNNNSSHDKSEHSGHNFVTYSVLKKQGDQTDSKIITRSRFPNIIDKKLSRERRINKTKDILLKDFLNNNKNIEQPVYLQALTSYTTTWFNEILLQPYYLAKNYQADYRGWNLAWQFLKLLIPWLIIFTLFLLRLILTIGLVIIAFLILLPFMIIGSLFAYDLDVLISDFFFALFRKTFIYLTSWLGLLCDAIKNKQHLLIAELIQSVHLVNKEMHDQNNNTQNFVYLANFGFTQFDQANNSHTQDAKEIRTLREMAIVKLLSDLNLNINQLTQANNNLTDNYKNFLGQINIDNKNYHNYFYNYNVNNQTPRAIINNLRNNLNNIFNNINLNSLENKPTAENLRTLAGYALLQIFLSRDGLNQPNPQMRRLINVLMIILEDNPFIFCKSGCDRTQAIASDEAALFLEPDLYTALYDTVAHNKSSQQLASAFDMFADTINFQDLLNKISDRVDHNHTSGATQQFAIGDNGWFSKATTQDEDLFYYDTNAVNSETQSTTGRSQNHANYKVLNKIAKADKKNNKKHDHYFDNSQNFLNHSNNNKNNNKDNILDQSITRSAFFAA